jgi:hypothetical protein
MIPEGRHMIWLGDVPVVFVRPWLHPDFTVVLGTDGMRKIGLIEDAGRPMASSPSFSSSQGRDQRPFLDEIRDVGRFPRLGRFQLTARIP